MVCVYIYTHNMCVCIYIYVSNSFRALTKRHEPTSRQGWINWDERAFPHKEGAQHDQIHFLMVSIGRCIHIYIYICDNRMKGWQTQGFDYLMTVKLSLLRCWQRREAEDVPFPSTPRPVFGDFLVAECVRDGWFFTGKLPPEIARSMFRMSGQDYVLGYMIPWGSAMLCCPVDCSPHLLDNGEWS